MEEKTKYLLMSSPKICEIECCPPNFSTTPHTFSCFQLRRPELNEVMFSKDGEVVSFSFWDGIGFHLLRLLWIRCGLDEFFNDFVVVAVLTILILGVGGVIVVVF